MSRSPVTIIAIVLLLIVFAGLIPAIVITQDSDRSFTYTQQEGESIVIASDIDSTVNEVQATTTNNTFYGLEFNATAEDEVELPNQGFSGNDDIGFTALINVSDETLGSERTISWGGTFQSNNAIRLAVTNSGILRVQNQDETIQFRIPNFQPNTEYWVGYTYVGATNEVTIYVENSEHTDSFSQDQSLQNQNWRIGVSFLGSPDAYDGIIRNAAFYETVYTKAEFDNIRLNQNYPTAKLRSQYLFDEGAGSVVEDNVGSRDGTINGADWVEVLETIEPYVSLTVVENDDGIFDIERLEVGNSTSVILGGDNFTITNGKIAASDRVILSYTFPPYHSWPNSLITIANNWPLILLVFAVLFIGGVIVVAMAGEYQ